MWINALSNAIKGNLKLLSQLFLSIFSFLKNDVYLYWLVYKEVLCKLKFIDENNIVYFWFLYKFYVI